MLRHLFTSTIILSGAAIAASPVSAQNYEVYAQQAQGYVASANTGGTDAHSACKSGETKRKLIGGALGGAAGSYAGAKIAGDDDETKGAVIGGLIGGAAGYGLADKTVDCDPVYEDRYGQPYANSQPYNGAGHAGSNYSQGAAYSQPAPSYRQTASGAGYTHAAAYTAPQAAATQSGYGERTYVSNHPAYSDPSYGADMRRIYVDRQASALTQASTSYAPVQTETVRYAPAPVQTVRYASPATYQTTAPTQTYSQTQPVVYSAPTPSRVPVRHMLSGQRHMHGKYACTQAH